MSWLGLWLAPGMLMHNAAGWQEKDEQHRGTGLQVCS